MRLAIVRHGLTEWARIGRHTGRTDVPLTQRGEEEAVALGPRLRALGFRRALTSPRLRARRTCELAGFGDVAAVDPDLAEWDYGDFEGLTSTEIERVRPGWDIFHDGCPGGESPAHVTARADRVIERLRGLADTTVAFSHGHFLRVLGARWPRWPITAARHLPLDTAAICLLDMDPHLIDVPVLVAWNCRGE